MFLGNYLGRFQFDNNQILNQQIRKIFAHRFGFLIHLNTFLRHDVKPQLL